MYCNKCGTQLPDGAVTCMNCGANVAPAPQPQQTYAAPQQGYVPPQGYTPPQGYAPQQGYVPPQGYAPQQGYAAPKQDSGLTIAAKVFMIIGTVAMGLLYYFIPLAWCIPMTVVYFKKVKNNEPIGTGFKVCCLLFVSMLGGIFMLCDKKH